jgi:hypothetical protein
MERVRAPVSSVESSTEVPSLAPWEPAAAPPSLEHLALTGRTTPGSAGRAAVNQIHATLRSLPATEENGAALLKLLDDGAFNELRADDGSSTRELAVETLLRLGYPWALRIHPDELAWFRRAQKTAKQLKLTILLGVLALAGGAAAYLISLL